MEHSAFDSRGSQNCVLTPHFVYIVLFLFWIGEIMKQFKVIKTKLFTYDKICCLPDLVPEAALE